MNVEVSLEIEYGQLTKQQALLPQPWQEFSEVLRRVLQAPELMYAMQRLLDSMRWGFQPCL